MSNYEPDIPSDGDREPEVTDSTSAFETPPTDSIPDDAIPSDGTTDSVPDDSILDDAIPSDGTTDAIPDESMPHDSPTEDVHDSPGSDLPPPPYEPPPTDSTAEDGAGWAPPPNYGPDPGYGPDTGQYAQPPIRRLYLSSDDRKVGGVAGGIAEYFNVDATLIRLATIIVALSGVGLVAYLIAWLIVPQRPDGYMHPQNANPTFNDRTLSAAFGIFGIALAAGFVTDSWEAFAIALIGGGIWLLSERTPTLATAAPAGIPNAYAPATPATTRPMAFSQSPAPTASAVQPPVAPMAAPAPLPPKEPPAPRKPQTVTWVVLSTLAILAGFGVAAASGDWWDVSVARFWGIGLIIIGIGVVLGQLRGGGRGLIPIGILATLALFPVSVADDALSGGFGDESYSPTTIDELRDEYELGVGQLIVDFSELDLNGEDAAVDIDLGIGELIVIVPDSIGGQASIDVDAGEIVYEVNGRRTYQDGIAIDEQNLQFTGEDGTLDLEIHVGLGVAELEVERDS